MSHGITTTTIGYAAAARLVSEAIAHAQANGWAVAAAVVDPSGVLVALGRMDGVPAPVVDFASDKAYTAGTLGKSTQAFFAETDGDAQQTAGALTRPRLIAWPGGVAIYEDGTLLGSLGVSGAAGPDDIACAEHALATLELTPG